ncbi:fluoride efflux transporter CrcB [Bacillus carboniphilus]|uniref:Fluoride-specific ion channel FluC n=1 Tax=Bacillus carboniphilus TaxID=86663 RepID=A0ABP3FYJ9_9BACI
MNFKPLLYVTTGGFTGSILRYTLGEWLHSGSGFPVGTLFVNLTGCFLLGWLLTFIGTRTKKRPEVQMFFGTGLIGSFTTFSTFSVETIHLIENEQFIMAFFYVLLSMIIGVLLVLAGRKLVLIRGQKEERT